MRNLLSVVGGLFGGAIVLLQYGYLPAFVVTLGLAGVYYLIGRQTEDPRWLWDSSRRTIGGTIGFVVLSWVLFALSDVFIFLFWPILLAAELESALGLGSETTVAVFLLLSQVGAVYVIGVGALIDRATRERTEMEVIS